MQTPGEIPEIKIQLQNTDQTPAAQPQEQDDSARFSERFIAYVIDALPFLLICYATLYYAVHNMGVKFSPALELKWKLVWIGVYIIYLTIFCSNGLVSLGKWIMGIRVVAKDGSNLSLGASFARALGYFVSSVILNMGFIMALFTKSHRALHDFIAGSRVIRTREKGDFATGLTLVLSWGLVGLLSAAWYHENFLMQTPQDKQLIAEANKQLEVIAYLEKMHKKQFGSYTDDINRLAVLSGNPAIFRKELLKSLQETDFQIAGGKDNYFLSGHAKDRRKTRVQVTGP